VDNGDFSAWEDDGNPLGWKLYTKNPGRGEVRWVRVDLANSAAQNEGRHNYALGLFVRSIQRRKSAPGYGVARTRLNNNKAGYYWVTVHITAWGTKRTPYNSVAWYATSPDREWQDLPDSAWRELYPDELVCANDAERCAYLSRQETVYLEPKSYLFLKGEMKYPVWQAWTVWVWDDVSVVELSQPEFLSGWIADGVVTWDQHAER